MNDGLLVKFNETLARARAGYCIKRFFMALGAGAGVFFATAAAGQLAGARQAELWLSAACAGVAVAGVFIQKTPPATIARKLDRALGMEAFGAALETGSEMRVLCARDALSGLGGRPAFRVLFSGAAAALAAPMAGLSFWLLAQGGGAQPPSNSKFTDQAVQAVARLASTVLSTENLAADERAIASELMTQVSAARDAAGPKRDALEREIQQLLDRLAEKRGLPETTKRDGSRVAELASLYQDSWVNPAVSERRDRGIENNNSQANASENKQSAGGPRGPENGAAAKGGSGDASRTAQGETHSPTPATPRDAQPVAVSAEAQSWPERYDIVVRRYFALRSNSPATQPNPQNR